MRIQTLVTLVLAASLITSAIVVALKSKTSSQIAQPTPDPVISPEPSSRRNGRKGASHPFQELRGLLRNEASTPEDGSRLQEALNRYRNYLRSLPPKTNFRIESQNLLLISEKHRDLLDHVGLELALASRWMNSDPDEASAYWTMVNEPEVEPDAFWVYPSGSGRERGFQMGELVNEWVRSFSLEDSGVHRRAADWMIERGWIQNHEFLEKGLCCLAQGNPKIALELISRAPSYDQQAKLLIEGVAPPPASPINFLHESMTLAFTTEMIQQEIDTNRFSGRTLRQLREALQARQDFEAHKNN